MKKRFLSFILAGTLSTGIVPVSTYAEPDPVLMTGAERYIVSTIENAQLVCEADIAAAEETGEAKPFFGYSPEHGYAYADIEKRTDLSAEEKAECLDFYDALFYACQGFSRNYEDLEKWVFYYPDGTSEVVNLLRGAHKPYTYAKDRLTEVYFMFRNDHPEYYWLSNEFSVQTVSEGEKTAYCPVVRIYEDYVFGENRYNLDTRMQEVLDLYMDRISEEYTDYQKVRLIHDMIINNVKYGYEDEDKTQPLDTTYAHSIVGVFDGDRDTDVVCEGYAKSFQLLLHCAGIDNVIVTGDADTGAAERERHMWNMAALDGRYYYFDLTWDDTSKNNVKYFAKGAESGFLTEHHAFDNQHSGTEYLYMLPEADEEDYEYDEQDTIAAPEPFEDFGVLPWATPTPVPTLKPFENEASVPASQLLCRLPDIELFKNYGALYELEISIDGTYDIDYTAEYDGVRLSRIQFNAARSGMYEGSTVDFDKLMIKAETGTEITGLPIYYAKGSSSQVYRNDALTKTVTAGAPAPEFNRETQMADLVDFTKYKNNWNKIGNLLIDIQTAESRAVYGKDYVVTYNDIELPYEECFIFDGKNGNYYLSNVSISDDDVEDIIERLKIKNAVDIRVKTQPWYSIGEGRINSDNRVIKTTEISAPEITTDKPIPTATVLPTNTPAPTETAKPTPVPICVNTALEYGSFEVPVGGGETQFMEDVVKITVTKDRYLPKDNTHLYYAIYDETGVMRSLRETEFYERNGTQTIYIINNGNRNVVYKVFVMTADSLAPLANMQQLKIE